MKTAFPHIRPSSLGLRLNVTTSSVSYTLPLAADGTNPRYLRLQTEIGPSGISSCCYVNVGQAAVTAQNGNLLVSSNEAVIIQSRGMGYISVFHPSQTCNLSVTPLEDC